jgi:hypothetical protein
MFCINCGGQLPEDARFCRRCGKAQTINAQPAVFHPISWEYKDVNVSLNLKWNGSASLPGRIYNTADQLILQKLQNESKDGWQSEGPTDFMSLRRAGKTYEKCNGPLGFMGIGTGTIQSVIVRLKRLI